MRSGKLGAVVIVFVLLPLIGYLANFGLPYNLVFSLVFVSINMMLLIVIKRRLEKIYGRSRAINIFVYGFGLISLLFNVLVNLQP